MANAPESTIGHTAEATAAVNAGTPVTLYNPAGMEISVPPDMVDYWLGQGFSLTAADPAATAKELAALLPAVESASTALLAEIEQHQHIDPAADAGLATFAAAMDELTGTANRLLADIHRQYGIKQGTGVAMLLPDGQTRTEVDPTQVSLYEGQGYTRAEEQPS